MTLAIGLREVRALWIALALALLILFVPAPSAGASPVELTGTLPNGTAWRAVVPDEWNGTLLLYSHGYLPSFVPIPNDPRISPDPITEAALLELGYALAGSSYASAGWALPTAPDDQLDSLAQVVAAIGTEPELVLAYGSSMGGLVTGRLAESAGDDIDGALPTCGIVAGGIDLSNYQLDGAHVINELLAPEIDIELVDYATLGEAFTATQQMTAALQEAQLTPEGRARIALAAAFFQVPDWLPGSGEPAAHDHEARQLAQYEWLVQTLGFVVPARYDIEVAGGGNASWNAGVDYRRLFWASADRSTVWALYRRAGLDLGEDLRHLTDTADVSAEPDAFASMRSHSHLEGDLQIPVFSVHTTDDNLVPVQHEEEYAEDVREQGRHGLLRQAFVARPGHCAFTAAEIVAGVHVLERRVKTGHWDPASVLPWKLNALAESLDRQTTTDLGDPAYVRFRPGEFLGDRT